MDFATMQELEPHGSDTFVGVGPRYPWGGLYGGQIVAQALRAAALTVPGEFHAHSLHAYFIRRGDHDEPVRYEVDRVRNGRSFCTRSVVARQAVGAILNLSASFQVDEPGPDARADAMPRDVPPPDELTGISWSPMFERRSVPTAEPGVVRAWLRMNAPVGDDPLLHTCAIAYTSDDLPTEAVVTLHPLRPTDLGGEWSVMTASLDHAMWFHRQARADTWLLHEFRCDTLIGTRGVATGRVFTEDGTLVATVAQEVLLRAR